VIGAGYVGLTTAACLANLGHIVRCADVDAEKIRRLSAAEAVLHEDELGQLVRNGLATGALSFGTSNAWAVDGGEFTFLCLPTPAGLDGSPDVAQLRAVVLELSGHLESGSVLCVRSTVPVGTIRRIGPLLGRPDVDVIYNPAFLREGSAVRDFLSPDRFVIGTDTPSAAATMVDTFSPPGANILVIDPVTAEVLKLSSNAFLATKLSFANVLAAVCEEVGADVRQVTEGLSMDPRVGRGYLSPGLGWGGPCLEKDTMGLVRIAQQTGCNSSLLMSSIIVNEVQIERIASKVVIGAGGSIDGKRVALWGLTYKAGTNDVRRSPALLIAERLTRQGALVVAYDPVAVGPLDGIVMADDPYIACDGASVALVATEWEEFRYLDFSMAGARMANRAIVDGRNLLDPEMLRRAGFHYISVGASMTRPPTVPSRTASM